MESQRVGHDWVTFTSLLSNFQVQGTIPSTIITLLWNRSQEFWFPQGIHPAVGFCWVIWQFYFQGVLCVCVCVNQKMIFLKKISREKHQIIVFFSGWKEEWIRKLTACFLKCFLTEHWGCKSEKKKKSLKHVRLTILCLTLSGNLEELQFWPVGGSSMGNHREEKRLWVCSLHSQEPEWITKNWPWKPGRWAVDTEPTNNLIPCHASRETQK